MVDTKIAQTLNNIVIWTLMRTVNVEVTYQEVVARQYKPQNKVTYDASWGVDYLSIFESTADEEYVDGQERRASIQRKRHTLMVLSVLSAALLWSQGGLGVGLWLIFIALDVKSTYGIYFDTSLSELNEDLKDLLDRGDQMVLNASLSKYECIRQNDGLMNFDVDVIRAAHRWCVLHVALAAILGLF